MKLPYKLIKREQLDALQKEVNKLLIANQKATAFIREIENGNLDAGFELEDAQADNLAGALISMQQQLQKIAEEEKQRNWATQGVAMFAEILRSDNSDPKAFYQKIISRLVKYVDANQGGLFLVNEQDEHHTELELVSCYAYNRQKYTTKKLAPGEGLVGQCYLEKESIFMTQIPQHYLQITSGLGESNPDCLVIIPLKINDAIHGILEIASFHVLKPYQVEFLEKLGESIASTISNIKINSKTKKLLLDSQSQAEELRAQEEEMRQNMEELTATQENQYRLQEELKANEEELRQQLEALADAKAETERVRQIEQERANKRIETQTKATEKLVAKFKENELALKNELAKLQEELSIFRNNQTN